MTRYAKISAGLKFSANTTHNPAILDTRPIFSDLDIVYTNGQELLSRVRTTADKRVQLSSIASAGAAVDVVQAKNNGSVDVDLILYQVKAVSLSAALGTVTFASATQGTLNADTIARSAGSFIADGYAAGETVWVPFPPITENIPGVVSANGGPHKITKVEAGALTMTDDEALLAQVSTTTNLYRLVRSVIPLPAGYIAVIPKVLSDAGVNVDWASGTAEVVVAACGS